MPALPPYQAITPANRTPVVLIAFCAGLTAGILIAFGILQNRPSAVIIEEDGKRIISASSCNVFHESNALYKAPDAVRYRVQLLRVVDGDTIRVIWHGENIAVRLLGIDAPERNQPGGPESAECLRELLAGADSVDLEFEGAAPRRDSLGRLLAYVWRGNLHLNLELVKRDHAGLYKGGGKGKHGDVLRQAVRTRTK